MESSQGYQSLTSFFLNSGLLPTVYTGLCRHSQTPNQVDKWRQPLGVKRGETDNSRSRLPRVALYPGYGCEYDGHRSCLVLSTTRKGESDCLLQQNLGTPNYCVTSRELLAVVKAIKHYWPYLYRTQFKLRIEHASIRWLCRQHKPFV